MCQVGEEAGWRGFICSLMENNGKVRRDHLYASSQRRHQQFYHTPSEIRRICVHEHIGCALQDSKVQHFRSHCLFTWHRWNIIVSFLKKNKNITLLTLEKLCDIIKCTPNDIVRFTKRLMGPLTWLTCFVYHEHFSDLQGEIDLNDSILSRAL